MQLISSSPLNKGGWGGEVVQGYILSLDCFNHKIISFENYWLIMKISGIS
jgi:hypothetical protein